MKKQCAACLAGPSGHARHDDLHAPRGAGEDAFRCATCGTRWAALPASFGGRAWILITGSSAAPGFVSP
jgi:hypothetical protein